MVSSPTLLDQLWKVPDFEKLVPQLQANLLHHVIQASGLEDCAELVALATPRQLGRVLDADLWRVRTPGGDEEFDADRFGAWIAVLMQSGATVAAEKLIGLDISLVITGLVRHVTVFDQAAVSSYTTSDGVLVSGREMRGGSVCAIGGYVIEGRPTSSNWEAIVDLLAFLDAQHPDHFHRMMRWCVRLSSGRREEDGAHQLLQDNEQYVFDLLVERELRRDREGFVTPAQARAFLISARDLDFHLDRPPASESARAYFRGLESALASERGEGEGESVESRPDAPSELETAAVIGILRDAGVVVAAPRALLGAGKPDRPDPALITAHVEAHADSSEELAYLANAIMAGCTIQGRPFKAREASSGAAATCNLGLENWPKGWTEPDLVTAFQVGWTILHRDVCMYAAQQVIDVLPGIRCTDRDIRLRLKALRRGLIEGVRVGEPWRARNALDVIMMLDAQSWAALLGLIDEYPVVHAALSASGTSVRRINPVDFEFVSTSSQIAAVREFLALLPAALVV